MPFTTPFTTLLPRSAKEFATESHLRELPLFDLLSSKQAMFDLAENFKR
jgi:hypothetical protein